ncbi:hypothetical protein DS901_16205 [Loktanella sp. D2R18]|uniref:hypothetical protein n=1 Tax=Rhodobacterales TaxID=204455 RepID=UPI000DE89470|nr:MULTISPECIES: hypothetical protein [Rhodobacterales]MDO6590993.1 hypothetical protein [Yoonia sp. 1_MG-2023]RBW42247.1 hypothetical protein DS901_16205 [Loktanella sp. D2R18]
MLVARSFLFSFSILWRLCLVAPFLLILLAFFGIVGLFVLTIAAAVSPLLAILCVAAASFAISSSFPIIVASRLGFQARGEQSSYGYGRMFMYSLIYGLVEAFILVLIIGIAIVVGVVVTGSGFSMAQLETSLTGATELYVSGGTFVIVGFIRAGMLVPMAGAAIGRDGNNQPHTPFYDFGTRWRSLWMTNMLAMIVGPLAIVALAIVWVQYGGSAVDDFAAAYESDNLSGVDIGWELIIFFVAVYALSLWTISWQAAAGVLAYMEKRDAQHIEEVVHSDDDRAAAQNLWKDRMPPGRR